MGDDGYFRFEPGEMPEWVRLARENFEREFNQFLAELPYLGASPLETLRTHAVIQADGTAYFGVPRREVDLSPEAMRLLRDSLDATLAYYGTSGELEARGYWLPVDESDHRPAD